MSDAAEALQVYLENISDAELAEHGRDVLEQDSGWGGPARESLQKLYDRFHLHGPGTINKEILGRIVSRFLEENAD